MFDPPVLAEVLRHAFVLTVLVVLCALVVALVRG